MNSSLCLLMILRTSEVLSLKYHVSCYVKLFVSDTDMWIVSNETPAVPNLRRQKAVNYKIPPELRPAEVGDRSPSLSDSNARTSRKARNLESDTEDDDLLSGGEYRPPPSPNLTLSKSNNSVSRTIERVQQNAGASSNGEHRPPPKSNLTLSKSNDVVPRTVEPLQKNAEASSNGEYTGPTKSSILMAGIAIDVRDPLDQYIDALTNIVAESCKF